MPAITSNLSSVLTINTSAPVNTPFPTDTFNSTTTVGSYAAGPITILVDAANNPTAVPLGDPSETVTTAYHLLIAHTGAATDPDITLNMLNGHAQNNNLVIRPGGRMYLYNVSLRGTSDGASGDDLDLSFYSSWTLSVDSGNTTCTLALCYA